MKKEIIATITEEILNKITENNNWSGPEGECWCKALGRNVSPKQDDYYQISKICPECQSLFLLDKRQIDNIYMGG